MEGLSQRYVIPSKLVDQYSRYIDSPVQRLKFLDSMHRYDKGSPNLAARLLNRIPVVGSLKQRAYMSLELAKLLNPGKKLPLPLQITYLLYKVRLAVYAVCFLGALAFGAGAVYLVVRFAGNLSVEAKDKQMARAAPAAGSTSLKPDLSAISTLESVGAKAGLPLDRVWLADQGQGYEFYSNGARVLTEFQTSGAERKFYEFRLAGSGKDFEPVLQTKPVGIVFHVSESDKLPFTGRFNLSLQSASRGLLEYARNNRLYNYIIDRFGRIYRIVPDDQVANHAGNSVWGNWRNFYVNLNDSFIGVCFEGKYSAGKSVGPDSVNEAQIIAARVLTAVLRSKYGIEDANCVTHGLVSVNPSNYLMGYHTDWVSGFPFQAVGLTEKSASEILAISGLGFTYDQSYVSAAGGSRWQGLNQSDAKVSTEAKTDGLTLEQERDERRRVFERAYNMQHDLDHSQDAQQDLAHVPAD
ncbi:MAG: peptidoglycan recognition protein family protein [Blastocatellia bacterium]